jgi:2-keto-4-pentenoate hydratase/2-oxohepta-3-ene-1,7-dioic acid hydratase in catechol pathway
MTRQNNIQLIAACYGFSGGNYNKIRTFKGGENMQIVRFSVKGVTRYGKLEGDIITGFRGDPFNDTGVHGSPVPDGNSYNLHDVKLLAPCLPSKIVCLGLNYRSHAREFNLTIPPVPLIFLKPSTAVIGPGDTIILPRSSKRVDYEGELAVVVSKTAKAVSEADAKDYVLGYTCFNDVSERHNQKEDGQWTRAKGYDSFAPIGPCIVTSINADDLKIETLLNGEVRQSARTSDLIYNIATLVSFISGIMTLLPGDVIATGTSSGVGRMNPGDTVEVKIENIGTLKNTVVNSA